MGNKNLGEPGNRKEAMKKVIADQTDEGAPPQEVNKSPEEKAIEIIHQGQKDEEDLNIQDI